MKRMREPWIDVVKGIAIIFVVMGHVVASYRNSGLLKDAVIFNFVCEFVYVFHMPLFFVISGYLSSISSREKSLRLSILRKCVSYGIPYVIFSMVAVALNSAASIVTNTKLSVTDFLRIPVYPISSLWFLYALLIISVVQILLKRVEKMNGGRVVLLMAALVVKVAAHLIGSIDAVKSSGLSSCILFDAGKYWFWYVLGENFQWTCCSKKSAPSVWICAGITLLYIAVVYVLQSINVGGVLIGLVLALFGVWLCCAWAIKISHCKWLEYLGKWTLPIYLLHGYVISFVRVLLTKFHIPLGKGLVPMLLCTTLGVAAPLGAYLIFKRIWKLDFVFYPGKYILRERNSNKG